MIETNYIKCLTSAFYAEGALRRERIVKGVELPSLAYHQALIPKLFLS